MLTNSERGGYLKIMKIATRIEFVGAIVLCTCFSSAQNADRAKTLENGKALGKAMSAFISRNGGKLPVSTIPAVVQRKLFPYIKSSAIWSSLNPKGGEFFFNVDLAGKTLKSLNAKTAWIFAEQNMWSDKKKAVVFADGRSVFVTEAEWKKIARVTQPHEVHQPMPGAAKPKKKGKKGK